MSDHEHTPPSAAGFIEPFGMRVQIDPAASGTPFFDARSFLTAFLDDVAAACEAEGASLIGHIKCFLSNGHDSVHCNLTSRRIGACCGGSDTGHLPLDRPIDVDLAVLVYGLPREAITLLVLRALEQRLEPLGVAWRES